MCGIAGFIDYTNGSDTGILDKMIKTLNHRGPDDQGVEVVNLNKAKVGLAHSRLSIIDLSQAGHQPMIYKDLLVSYNGEVYNFKEIKKELTKLGHVFNTHSDTEVILHAYSQWGAKCVDHFIGMFAFCILDKQTNKVLLFRDRAGVKPLYYYSKDNLFLFSSELKAFHQHPRFEKNINKSAVKQYFHLGYIPHPKTIFENAHKLSPGHYLEYNLETQNISITHYWDVENFYKKDKIDISYQEAKNKTKQLLISACNYRMISDVPVGVFLSGGYDSALVSSILQDQGAQKINTFTIGFEEGNNEAPEAAKTAKFLGTQHTEYTCTKKDAQDIIPNLTYFYDEPFADSSAIPTMLVSRLAKQNIGVALSADAGDEVYGGYDRYFMMKHHLHKMNQVPSWANDIGALSAKFLCHLIPSSKTQLKHKVVGLSRSLNKNSMTQAVRLYENMNMLPATIIEKLFSSRVEVENIFGKIETSGFRSEIEIAMCIDYKNYLSDDILAKVDRATMSVSLEGREPLLDHRLIELSARLPIDYKISQNYGKKILKDIVHDYIPREMMERPKKGFRIPLENWLKTDLKDILDQYLSPEAIRQTKIFNEDYVEKLVSLFIKGKLHYKQIIWRLLIFQMWYFRWVLNKE